jgi:hypothetical protein
MNYNFVYHLPTVMVAIAGIVVGIVYLGRARSASILLICGFVVLLVSGIGSAAFFAWIFRPEAGESMAQIATIRILGSVVFTLAHAAGLVLVVIAVFAGRRLQQPPAILGTPPPVYGGR